MQEIIIDNIGRKIKLRKVGVLEQLRLYKALGPELSVNTAYMQAAYIAAAVEMIDNVPIFFPINEARLEAILEQIGLDSMALIADVLSSGTEEEITAQAGK